MWFRGMNQNWVKRERLQASEVNSLQSKSTDWFLFDGNIGLNKLIIETRVSKLTIKTRE